MVKKTLLQWRWALEGPMAMDDEFPTRTLEAHAAWHSALVLEDGGYSVVREMGRGGQGIMYLAKKAEEKSSWTSYLSTCALQVVNGELVSDSSM